jgi:hypothetical protein
MAKKRKETESEKEVDFKMPKFDKEKFIKNEKQKIRITVISFIFGILIALISFGFWTLLRGNDFRWELVLLFGVFSAAWLRYIFTKLNFDFSELGRRGFLTSYAFYFFTWLLVLIVLVNPPFYDDESPNIELAVLPNAQELGGTIKIVARITDNVGVNIDGINFSLEDPNGVVYYPEDFTFEDDIFQYIYENNENIIGTFEFMINVMDISGIKIDSEKGLGLFKYDNDIIKLPDPAGANNSSGVDVLYTTDIIFDVKSNVSRFFYKINNESEINVTKDGEYFKTSPKIKGWKKGSDVTLNAFAEIIFYFDNLDTEFNNTIIDSDTYYFNVSNDPEIGDDDPPKIELPHPRFVQVPGFEIVVFIISLVIILFILRFYKKDIKK